MAADPVDQETILADALKLAAGKERNDYLAQACGDDPALKETLERLLEAHDRTGTAETLGPTLEPYLTEAAGEPAHGGRGGRAGEIIADRYELIRPIGEGGMGEVWMARQHAPVKRDVAIKLVKAGMDSRTVLARFEQERQALAMMDHPNIAKVLDGGIADGRPYFVMELVDGVPITAYCDARRLTPGERLELFVPVCRAIQHAHQKGIVHRDIKPNNVLVALYDDKPVPKVIDFGIAKATEQRIAGDSVHTDFGGIVGTPEYMSPEQATLDYRDIDTRSDIYSLGVLLYELLTGSTPFSRRELRNRGLLEILRVVREEEPPRPSTRLSTVEALPDVAANRGTEPKKLAAMLRSDLDWVVMKALEKDRSRRYDTANGFAADILRHLRGEPVEAHPPGRAYRVRKFLRRNRGPVLAAAAIAAVLLAGVFGFAWQATVARGQRDRAVLAESETKKRADELEKVASFQAEMFAQIDPAEAGRRLSSDVKARFAAALVKSGVPEAERTKTAEEFSRLWSRVNATDVALGLIEGEILKPAVVTIDIRFKDQPVVDAALRHTLGNLYHDLGLYESALPLLERALAERRSKLGEDHPRTLDSTGAVGVALHMLARSDEAAPYYRTALDGSRRVLGNEHPGTLTAVQNMGTLLTERGRFDEALPYYREAFESRRRTLGDDHPHTIVSSNLLAKLLKEQGKLDEASPLLEEVLKNKRRVFGEDHRSTLSTLNDLGALRLAQSRSEEAVKIFREVVEKRRRLLGETHPETLNAIQNLGATLDIAVKRDEAEVRLREAFENQRRTLGLEHPDTLVSLNNLVVYLVQHGKASEAEPMARDLVEMNVKVNGPDHPATLVAHNVMGFVLRRLGRTAEVERYVRKAVEIGTRTLGAEHLDTLTYTHNLGSVLREQGKRKEAEKVFRSALETSRRVLGPEHRVAKAAAVSLALTLVDLERHDEAIELLVAAEPAARKTSGGEEDLALAGLLSALGKARAAGKKYAEAEANLVEAHALYAKRHGPRHKDVRDLARALVALHTARHDADPAGGHDAKAAEWRRKLEEAEKETPAAKQ